MHLDERTALITGGSSGIGRAIAQALARQGLQVCLTARRRDALEAVANEIRASGGRAVVQSADLMRDEELQELTRTLEHDLGRLDVLVLCGGTIGHGTVEQASLADLDRQYRVNVRANYSLIQLLLPSLRRSRGQIVFINSSAGKRPRAGAGQFSAMQHALRALADTLRDEVNHDGIRVLSIYPGRTATPRVAAIFEDEARPYRPEVLLQPEDVAAMVAHALALPRTAEVTDISLRPMLKSY